MNRWMKWILNKEKSPGFRTGVIIVSGLLFLLTVLILIFPAFTLETSGDAEVSLAPEEVLLETLEENSVEEESEVSNTEEEKEESEEEKSLAPVELSHEDTLAVYLIRGDELTEASTVETLPIEESESIDELSAYDENIEENYEIVELVLGQPGESEITLEISPREERNVCLLKYQDDQVEQMKSEAESGNTFQFQTRDERLIVLFERLKDEGTHSDSGRQNKFTYEEEGVQGEYTDKTFAEVGGVYVDEFFMKNYNYMVFGDLNLENQCDLGVLVQGNMISQYGLTDFARSRYAVGPSYIGGIVSAPGAAIRREGALDTRENIGLYLNKSNNPLFKNDYTEKSDYKLAAPWWAANEVGGIYFVDQNFFDWEHAREFIDYAGETFLESSTETIVVDNMASWGPSAWDTVLTVKSGTTVTARFEDSENHETNLCYGYIDIVDTDQNTENLPTIINITGTTSQDYEQIFQLRYIDGVQVRADNYTSFGQNLILNFPDAETINVSQRAVFGHVLAPNATINLEGGDHFGCLVASQINSSSTGHAGVTGHVAETPQTITLEALKRVDDAVPTAEQVFTFELEQYVDEDQEAGIQAGFRPIGRNMENDGETIRTDLTNLSRLQTEYWFRITEAASSDSSYICDQTPYYARIVLKGTDFEKPVYYREKMASDPDDQAVQLSDLTLVPIDNEEGLPVFYNKTMKGVPMLPETGGIGQEPYIIAGFLVMAFGAAAVLYSVFRWRKHE